MTFRGRKKSRGNIGEGVGGKEMKIWKEKWEKGEGWTKRWLRQRKAIEKNVEKLRFA